MPLSGQQIRKIIAARKEREKAVCMEANVGTLREPPPLLRDLEHVAHILPRVVSKAQQKRSVLDRICTLERVLRNQNLVPAEREKLERALAVLKEQK